MGCWGWMLRDRGLCEQSSEEGAEQRAKLKVEEGRGGLPSQKKHGVCGLGDYYLWGAESRDIGRWEDVEECWSAPGVCQGEEGRNVLWRMNDSVQATQYRWEWYKLHLDPT